MINEHNKLLAKWPNEILAATNASNALCLALFGFDGELLFVNAGFKSFLKENPAQSLLNPTFERLLKSENTPLIFQGLMTIGDFDSQNTTIEAKVYRKDDEILILGEIDVANMLSQNNRMSALNQEVNNLQRQLMKEKMMLEKTLGDLRETQALLIHSEKMNALGQLVAGIAHEINNPLAFISSNFHSLNNSFNDIRDAFSAFHQFAINSENPSLNQNLAEVEKKFDLDFIFDDTADMIKASSEGLNRVKKIVEDLRTFSRLGESEIKTIELISNIKSVLSLVRAELKTRDIEVEMMAPDKLSLECYPSELNQVILNLLINSAQAIESKGKITITANSSTDEVIIEIADTGKGIPDDIQSQVFNPFFTTKPVGTGTGLGLSIAYKIVTGLHHGSINFSSKIGTGTIFKISLPTKVK